MNKDIINLTSKGAPLLELENQSEPTRSLLIQWPLYTQPELTTDLAGTRAKLGSEPAQAVGKKLRAVQKFHLAHYL
jgi:hypothetical protein